MSVALQRNPGPAPNRVAAARSRAVVLVLMGVLLVAACADRPAPTGAESAAIASGPNPCTNEDVDAAAGQWDGAGGQLFGFVIFRNRTARACVLAGFPLVNLLDIDGALLARPTGRFEVASVEPVVLAPGAAPITLVPGSSPPVAEGVEQGQALLRFLFGNLCRPAPRAVTIVLTLPGESAPIFLPTRLLGAPRCDAPNGSTSLAVGAFEPPPP